MTWELLIFLAIFGLFIAGAAATVVNALRDFPRHELEEYCKRHRCQDRFDDILDRHEPVALGAECLQILGVAIFSVSGGASILTMTRGVAAISQAQFATAVALSALLLLIAASWLPWTIVRIWCVPLIYHSWPVFSVVGRILWPLTMGGSVVNTLMRRLAGQPEEHEDEEEAFEDEIRAIVTTGHREGLLETDAREMIEGVIQLGDTDVSDIMTPRSNVDAFEIGLSWNEVLRFVVNVGRTRIPVYAESLDNILGVLFVKDLLAELSKPAGENHRPLREMLRAPWFVPKTKRVDDMLQDFLNTRNHLAIVLDEYESVAGVVTIEDVLEEIVGEIVDETDEDVEDDIRINGSFADVLGKTHLDELNARLGLDLPLSDDYDTVAGLVLDRLGHIPLAGESLVQGNIRIAVVAASKRRVERVRIELLNESNGNGRSSQ